MLLGINSHLLAAEIASARERIYFCGAGISVDVADSIVKASERIDSEDIIILTDASAHSRRLGYGEHRSLEMLSNVGVRLYELPDTRLAFCIVDNKAWIFSQLPAMVEKPDINLGFNCLELTGKEVTNLINTVHLLLRDSGIENKPTEDTSLQRGIFDEELKGKKESQPFPVPSISVKAKPLAKAEIRKTSTELKVNPPQRFDVSRQLTIFNSRLEFVELELQGIQIERQVFKFPDEIKSILTGDKDAHSRLSASYKMIDANSKLSSKKITGQIDELRNAFLRPMGELGRIIKRTQIPDFEKELEKIRKEIDKFSKTLEKKLDGELKKSRIALAKMLADRLKKNPPAGLIAFAEGGPITNKKARDYLNEVLEKYMPNSTKVAGNIKLRCDYKSVTYNMLKDNTFQQKIKALYPKEKWDQPLDESTVAHGTTHPNVRR